MKKVTGWIMFCIAAAIIAYNVNESKEDEKKFAKDPWVTLLTGGANLSDAYSLHRLTQGLKFSLYLPD